MVNFTIQGAHPTAVALVTHALGRALFLAGLDVKDYIDREGRGVVASDKQTVTSVDATNADVLIFIEQPPKDVRDGCVVLLYGNETAASLKKRKTKNYLVAAPGTADTKRVACLVLGATTKLVDKLSGKNMRLAIEAEIGKDKLLFDAFEEGHKVVKQLR